MNREPFRHTLLPTAVLLILCLAAPAFAGVLGIHDWETNNNPTAAAWTTSAGYITLTDLYQPSAGGDNASGWLRIDYDATADPGPYVTDYIYVPAAELFSGGWTNTMWVEFDFWASNTVPAMLQVVWQSSDTNANVWSFNLDDPTTNSWTHYLASFTNWLDWTGTDPFATEEMFLSDLADINWIGIGIRRYGQGQEFYGIDNFTLMVPEPAELFMLAAALMTSAASLRRKQRRKHTQAEAPT